MKRLLHVFMPAILAGAHRTGRAREWKRPGLRPGRLSV
jgi:hypothetical protein